MAKPRKCVDLRGVKQKMQVECQHCGHHKIIEYRRNGKSRRICGAVELKRLTPPPNPL